MVRRFGGSTGKRPGAVEYGSRGHLQENVPMLPDRIDKPGKNRRGGLSLSIWSAFDTCGSSVEWQKTPISL